jgi:hypothetical protein
MIQPRNPRRTAVVTAGVRMATQRCCRTSLNGVLPEVFGDSTIRAKKRIRQLSKRIEKCGRLHGIGAEKRRPHPHAIAGGKALCGTCRGIDGAGLLPRLAAPVGAIQEARL